MSTLSGVVRKFRWSVAQRGLLGTLSFAWSRIRAKEDGKPRVHPFDLQHGVDTSGLIGGADLATGHEHDVYNTAYYGMSPSRFQRAMERWMSLPGTGPIENYTFVDLGCGKGRAVLMATQLAFRAVIGVELNPQLVCAAEENLRIWEAEGKSLAPATILVADATEAELPDGPCLIYLFNPFARPVMEKLLDTIDVIFRDRAGALDVVYFNPEAAEAFDEHGGYKLMWSGVIPMSKEDAAADLVASPDDLCHLYRWVGQ